MTPEQLAQGILLGQYIHALKTQVANIGRMSTEDIAEFLTGKAREQVEAIISADINEQIAKAEAELADL